MNTIEAFEQEIKYQVTDLPKFIRELKTEKLNVDEQERCVLTGAGDSFVAAMITEYASNNKIRCTDPMNICLNPRIVKDRIVYTISISGNTRANIEAAKVASKISSKIVAITANSKSKLAKACDEVIELKFRSSGMITAGSIGFTASMLACLSLIKNLQISNVKELFSAAENDAGSLHLVDHTCILGSWTTYPLAMYGCAKIYEVLGTKAHYAMLEQFCHMELFSVKKNDSILILSDDDKASELATKLIDDGYNVYAFKPRHKNLEKNMLYYAMLLQLIVLQNAKRANLAECYFITNDRLRGISSSLIY
ncbi:MAG: SIS domain-containing protein [Nitrososphaerales archaeon]